MRHDHHPEIAFDRGGARARARRLRGEEAAARVRRCRRPSDTSRRQVAFGPRIPGTDGARADGGLARQPAPARGPIRSSSSAGPTSPRRATRCRSTNVIARFNPAARAAHPLPGALGHPPRRRRSALRPTRPTPMPGANDGGSGVAVLLGVADVLKRRRPAVARRRPAVRGRRGLRRLRRDADTDVLIGARYYAAAPAARAEAALRACCSTWSPTRTCRSTRRGTR